MIGWRVRPTSTRHRLEELEGYRDQQDCRLCRRRRHAPRPLRVVDPLRTYHRQSGWAHARGSPSRWRASAGGSRYRPDQLDHSCDERDFFRRSLEGDEDKDVDGGGPRGDLAQLAMMIWLGALVLAYFSVCFQVALWPHHDAFCFVFSTTWMATYTEKYSSSLSLSSNTYTSLRSHYRRI